MRHVAASCFDADDYPCLNCGQQVAVHLIKALSCHAKSQEATSFTHLHSLYDLIVSANADSFILYGEQRVLPCLKRFMEIVDRGHIGLEVQLIFDMLSHCRAKNLDKDCIDLIAFILIQTYDHNIVSGDFSLSSSQDKNQVLLGKSPISTELLLAKLQPLIEDVDIDRSTSVSIGIFSVFSILCRRERNKSFEEIIREALTSNRDAEVLCMMDAMSKFHLKPYTLLSLQSETLDNTCCSILYSISWEKPGETKLQVFKCLLKGHQGISMLTTKGFKKIFEELIMCMKEHESLPERVNVAMAIMSMLNANEMMKREDLDVDIGRFMEAYLVALWEEILLEIERYHDTDGDISNFAEIGDIVCSNNSFLRCAHRKTQFLWCRVDTNGLAPFAVILLHG